MIAPASVTATYSAIPRTRRAMPWPSRTTGSPRPNYGSRTGAFVRGLDDRGAEAFGSLRAAVREPLWSRACSGSALRSGEAEEKLLVVVVAEPVESPALLVVPAAGDRHEADRQPRY